MSNKKIQTILSLIEIAETNIKNAKTFLTQIIADESKGSVRSGERSESDNLTSPITLMGKINREESDAKEVVEGYFDGEYMIGDNGQTYIVPQNYASKTQLVVGDRMKWILTPDREIFKLIHPIDRERVEGVFTIDGENFYVVIDKYTEPVKILKASATFSIKTQGLEIGDIVAIMVPKNSQNPRWGALVNVVKSEHAAEIPINGAVTSNLSKIQLPKIPKSLNETDTDTESNYL